MLCLLACLQDMFLKTLTETHLLWATPRKKKVNMSKSQAKFISVVTPHVLESAAFSTLIEVTQVSEILNEMKFS